MPQGMVRLVVAVAVRRRGARKALVVLGMGRVDSMVRVAPKARGVLAARLVLGLQMVRGSIDRGWVPVLLVARVSTVLRVKPHLVIPRVGNRNLNRPAVVRVVRRIELSIHQTVPVYVSLFATRTPARMEIRASSVIALLLRRNVPVVRSPLKGPRARKSVR